jgi:hypothetical protein
MAGTNRLVCLGFIESDGFAQSKERLKQLLELTDRDIDDRLEALIWAFQHDDPDIPVAERVGSRNLWVARTDFPKLRIFLRPRAGVANECELLWIEEVD